MQLYTVRLYRVQLRFPVAAVFNTNGLFQKPENENKMARIAGIWVDNDAAAMFEYGHFIIWQHVSL